MNRGLLLVIADWVSTRTTAQNIPGTVVKHTGGLLAFDRRTATVLWRLPTPKPPDKSFGRLRGIAALAGDKVIATGSDGVLVTHFAH